MTVVGVPEGHLRHKLHPTLTSTFEPSAQLPLRRQLRQLRQNRSSTGGDVDSVPDGVIRHVYGLFFLSAKTAGANLDTHSAIIKDIDQNEIFLFRTQFLGGTTGNISEWIPISPELVLFGTLGTNRPSFQNGLVLGAGSSGSIDITWFFWDE